MSNDTDRLMTFLEVCDFLGLTAPTFYNMRYRGTAPKGYRVGRQLRFRRSEVDRWLAERADVPRDLPS